MDYSHARIPPWTPPQQGIRSMLATSAHSKLPTTMLMNRWNPGTLEQPPYQEFLHPTGWSRFRNAEHAKAEHIQQAHAARKAMIDPYDYNGYYRTPEKNWDMDDDVDPNWTPHDKQRWMEIQKQVAESYM